MHLPIYWSRATATGEDGRGKTRSFTCWRSSDVSRDDAHASAMTAARQALATLLLGNPLERYSYGVLPLREEVMQRFTNDAGEEIAAVTLNGYGSLVLNTAGVMFVDLDFPPVAGGEQFRHFVGRLFGRGGPSPEEVRQRDARDRVARFLERNQEWSARLYRTRAGMRVLVTHELFDPAADDTRSAFVTLGADPLYTRLCRGQQSFRARLTPKPWRCGHTVNRIRWPRETPEAEQAFEKWQAKYAALQAGYATCRFLETIGSGRVHPDAQHIIGVHDDVSRADAPLELA